MSTAINAETCLVGVMGWPVAHSLSPAMHNAVLADLGLNWRYVALPVRPGDVGAAVRGLAALGFRGCNVTVPHKQAVLTALPPDRVAPEARVLGAVNTLVFHRDGASQPLQAHNTDVAGFLGALRAAGFEPAGQRALVVGAGGAARSVVYGLLQAGAAQITVLNRTLAHASALVAELVSYGPAKTLQAGMLVPDVLTVAARQVDLLVNATTVGMWPQVEESIWPEACPLPSHLVVYDLVYNPLETRLLRQARQGGAHAIDGLGMLARQGALALDLWTEQALDVEAVTARMRAVCEAALQSS